MYKWQRKQTKILFESDKSKITEKIVLKRNIFLPVCLIVKHSVVTVLRESCFLLLVRSEVSTDHNSI